MRGFLTTRFRTARFALVGLFVTLSAEGCSAEAITVRDATGRNVTVTDSSRIVSIGGAVTEILYALGFEDHVVGVDTTSVYPERALAAKPNVGYMRQLSPEGVLGLSPTLILASDGAGPPSAVTVLEAAHVPFVRIPDRASADGVADKIQIVAEATGQRAAGACLAASVRADFAALAVERARLPQPLKVMFVLSFANDRPMVAGTDTAADSAIALAGGVNVMSDMRGYKPVSDEAVIAAKPDVVVAMERPKQAYVAETVFAHPAFAMTPAAERKRFLSIDGQYLLGFGPRAPRAVRDLAAYLYPDKAGDRLPSEQEASGVCHL
jgi:iron complex transport system substrate-binding protein